MSFSTFLRSKKYGIEAHIKFLQSWENNACIILDYNDLMNDNINNIVSAFKSLQINFDKDTLEKAVVETRRENAIRLKDKYTPKKYNFAEKRQRKIESYFDGNDKAYYNTTIDCKSLSNLKLEKI